MDMIATIHVILHVKDVMQLMVSATSDVCQGGEGSSARKVNCVHNLIYHSYIENMLVFWFFFAISKSITTSI